MWSVFLGSWLLDGAAGLTQLAVHWLFQSTLIIGVGIAAGQLLRSRGPALQSAVYRTTLFVVVACPLIGWLLSTVGLTLAPFRLPAMRVPVMQVVPVSARSESGDGDYGVSMPSVASSPSAAQARQRIGQRPMSMLEHAGEPRVTTSSAHESLSQAAVGTPPEVSATASLVPRVTWVARPAVAVTSLGIALLWLVGSALLLARLVFEYGQLQRVRTGAVPVGEDELELCRRFAGRMGVSPPALARTPCLSSPCLAGILRPVILLPEEMHGLPLSAVLVHELAHLGRRDCHWNLLRQVTLALLWFQPLAWRLSKRMEAAAEDVCDDHVVNCGADRRTYAHTLVTLAEQTLLPPSSAVVSLVTLRSLLSRRVGRILDGSRRLSLNVGFVALGMVATAGLVAMFLAGLLGPGGQIAVAAIDTEPNENDSSDNTPSKSDNAKSGDEREAIRRVSGNVLLSDGKPASEADVVLIARRRTSYRRGRLDQSAEMEVLGETRCDVHGKFEFPVARLAARPYLTVQLLARARGCGLAWQDVNADATRLQFTIPLPRASEARGRLVDPEGHGAANVRIQVDKIGRAGMGQFIGVDSMRAKLPDAVWPNQVVTDVEGWFVVSGVAAGSDLSLYAAQEPFAPQWWMWKADDKPEHAEVVSPAQVITGIVIAADTQEPIPNARLTAFQSWDPKRGGMVGVDGQADGKGRFRLNPFSANGYSVTAFAPDETTYLARKVEFEWPAAVKEHEVRIELPRGALLQGTITEQSSGRAVAGASVRYEPRRVNNLVPEDFVSGWQSTSVTDATGHYAIAVPRGPGYITALCPDRQHIVQETATQFLDEDKPGGRRLYVHAFAIFDFDVNSQGKTLDLSVKNGAVIQANIVSPDGTTPQRVLMAHRGMLAPYQEEFGHQALSFPGGRVEITGVPPDGGFPVYLLDPVRKQGRVVELRGADAGSPLQIELTQCGSATLRIVDADGKPLPGAAAGLNMVFTPGAPISEMLSAESMADETFVENFDRQNHWDLTTNEDGLVTFEALIPGVEYRLYGDDEKNKLVLDRVLRVQPGEHKQLADLVFHSPESIRNAEERWLKKQKENVANDRMPANQTANPTAAKRQTGGSTEAAAADASDRVELTGNVVDPDGRPAAAANVSLLYYWSGRTAITPAVTTGADGRFVLHVSKKDFFIADPSDPWPWGILVATTEGMGFALEFAAPFETTGQMLKALQARKNEWYAMAMADDRTLRLVKDDIPIDGRIVNLEGQGIAGARVEAIAVYANRKLGLEPWLRAIESKEQGLDQAWPLLPDGFSGLNLRDEIAQILPHAVTNADGRFRLAGLGRERLIELRVTGPGVETHLVYARTRPGSTLQIPYSAREPNDDKATCYATKLELAVAPSRPVIGVVQDKDTGKPLGGVTIAPESLAGARVTGTLSNSYIHAITDAEGRYRLEGLPIGENQIAALPPAGAAYLLAARYVTTEPAKAEATIDFELKKGVWIRGRVTDGETGKPLAARIEYFAFNNNPHLKSAAGLLGALQPFNTTDRNGSYQVVGIPGRGLITVLATDNPEDYPRGAGFENINGGTIEGQDKILNTFPYFFVRMNAHALAEVNPEPSAVAFERNFELRRGRHVAGTVLDREGQPLAGAMCLGQLDARYWKPLVGADFVVRHLESGQSRRVLFYHEGRRLAGSLLVRGDDSAPLAVTLEPWGVVTGRIFNESDDAAREVSLSNGMARGAPETETGILPDSKTPFTDREGRFTITGLAPGVSYGIAASNRSQYLGVAIEKFEITAGETKDLGDLKIKSPQ